MCVLEGPFWGYYFCIGLMRQLVSIVIMNAYVLNPDIINRHVHFNIYYFDSQKSEILCGSINSVSWTVTLCVW